MKIHEYQAKELCRRYSIPVPNGFLAADPSQARAAAKRLAAWPVAVKAQILAGGRGKGGGVRLAANEDQAEAAAKAILATPLVTAQTGPDGKKVRRLLVEEGLAIASELYLSILPDRDSGAIMIVASQAGGMEIETVADKNPEKIIKVAVDPLLSLQPFQCRRVAFGLGLEPDLRSPFATLLIDLFRLFIENDCSLVEINPLVVTADRRLVALDAKFQQDDNGLFRHPELAAWRDEGEMDPLELRAAKAGINYIRLDGDIGILVNGAGLAMATMDLIKGAGAAPANFLDVGGGASGEMIEEGFRIILAESGVQGILINIFGGILRCDILAGAIVAAVHRTGLQVPVVIRMEGTNAEEGRRILAESGLKLTPAADLVDAAGKIAAIAAA